METEKEEVAPPQVAMPDRVQVPKKKKNESYEEKQARINAHNFNFMKTHEKLAEDWSKTHPRVKPPIVKDDEGKLFWLNRKQRKAQLKRRKVATKGALPAAPNKSE